MTRPFFVNVADLVHRPAARRSVTVAAPIAGVAISGITVPAGSDVSVDHVLESVSEGVLASGSVCAPWRAECRRCLGAVEGRVGVEVRELFASLHDDEDDETYPLRDLHIDLEPLAREAILLELPLAALCGPRCRGLCPTCGADLNTEACPCVPEQPDPRWAVLDGLRTDQS
jgi:uncharacterized protein